MSKQIRRKMAGVLAAGMCFGVFGGNIQSIYGIEKVGVYTEINTETTQVEQSPIIDLGAQEVPASGMDIGQYISQLEALEEGTLVIEINPKGLGSIIGSVVGLGSNSHQDSYFSLYLKPNQVGVEFRSEGSHLNSFSGPATVDKTKVHTIALKVSKAEGKSKLFFDKKLVAETNNTKFFADLVGGFDHAHIGNLQRKNGSIWGMASALKSFKVYDVALADELLLEPVKQPERVVADQNKQTVSKGIDYNAQVDQVKHLEEGTMIIRFKPESYNTIGCLIGASNNAKTDDYFGLYVKGSRVGLEFRKDGAHLNSFEAEAGLGMDALHTLALKVDKALGVSKIFVNGKLVGTHNSGAFLSELPDITSLKVGALDRPNGKTWDLGAYVESFEIYNAPLSDADLIERTSETFYEGNVDIVYPEGVVKTADLPVFYGGYLGSPAYRIPALLTLKDGTVLAGIDKRKSSGDSPNEIDAMIRRSKDHGNTWEEGKVILDYPGAGGNGASVIDMSLLEDQETGKVFMLMDQFRGGVGAMQSVASTGCDANGYKLIYDYKANNKAYTMRPDSERPDWYTLYDDQGVVTNLTVDDTYDRATGKVKGQIYRDGVATPSSIYDKPQASTHEIIMTQGQTSFLQLQESEDGGVTWSAPKNLNFEVKESWMPFMGTGPGVGIQLKNQQDPSKNGRLIFPVYYTNPNVKQSSAVIYSDNHGESWERGASPNDGRIVGGVEIQSETLTINSAQLTESQVVELNDGTLKLFMRNTNGKVAIATSHDGGETWPELIYHPDLVEVYCQLSVVKYPSETQDILVLSRPEGPGRNNGTICISYDGGVTWPEKKRVKQGGYAYSCLTILENGNIGLLYEDNMYTGGSGCSNNFTSFNIPYIQFDESIGLEPKVEEIKFATPDGTYGVGDKVTIEVKFSRPMYFKNLDETTDTFILLNAGGEEPAKAYVKGSKTGAAIDQSFYFEYTIKETDQAAKLDNQGGIVLGSDEDFIPLQIAEPTGITNEVILDIEADTLGQSGQIAINNEEKVANITLETLKEINAGEILEVTVGIENAVDGVYAQDFTLEYDQEAFTYLETVETEGVEIAQQKVEAGKVRTLVADTEGKQNGETVTIRLQALPVSGDTNSEIRLAGAEWGVVKDANSQTQTVEGATATVTVKKVTETIDKTQLNNAIEEARKLSQEAVIGEAIGNYPLAAKEALDAAIETAQQVATSSEDQVVINEATQTLRTAMETFKAAQIKAEKEDINEDGSIDVADLAIVAYYYQVALGDPLWEEAKKADISGSNRIDLDDLTMIASAILLK